MRTTYQQGQYKYLTLFIVCFITCYLTSEVVINRLVSIGSGYITGGTFIYFVSPMVTDVVTEVYGYRVARQMLWYGIFSWLFLGVGVALCLKAPYPSFWASNAEAFNVALGPLLHASIVSSVAVITGQLINSYLISKWKILLRGRYFWLRSVTSSIIGDSITVTMSILGIFAGRIPAEAYMQTLLPEFFIMIFFSGIGAIPAMFIVNYVKKAENLDCYDVGVSFNPFKMALDDVANINEHEHTKKRTEG